MIPVCHTLTRTLVKTNIKTRREIVHRGLELMKLKEQKRIRRYRGKLRWRGDLDSARRS